MSIRREGERKGGEGGRESEGGGEGEREGESGHTDAKGM